MELDTLDPVVSASPLAPILDRQDRAIAITTPPGNLTAATVGNVPAPPHRTSELAEIRAAIEARRALRRRCH